MSRLLSLLPACLCALALPSPCAAAPFVERLDPPVLVRGKAARLTAVGSGLGGAVDVWSSLPKGAMAAKVVEAKAGSASFDVKLAGDAPVGVFGLRVATADGLSNVHLFLVEDLPAKPAPASDEAPAKVALPCALYGRFREAEVDRFAIEVAANQRVSFEVVGNRLGKDVDPLVVIRDGRNKAVAERDNDQGLYFDCRFEHTFAAAGTYVVEVRDVRHQGHEHGSYVLRMGRFPAARVAVPSAVRPGKRAKLFLPELDEWAEADVPAGAAEGPLSLPVKRKGDDGSAWVPVEVSDLEATAAEPDATTAKKGTKASVPGQLCGVLRKGNEPQFFRLELKKGQAIHVTGHGRWLNSSIDLSLSLTDEEGKALAQAGAVEDDRVRLSFTAPKDGTFCLAARDLARDGGRACGYRLEVRGEPPGPAVVAEVEGLTVPRGDHQIVPLKVTRNGFAGAIALELAGAPAGVTLTPSEIPAGVTSVVCKLSATEDAPLGLHTLQIWATPVKSTAPKALVRTRPLIDRQLVNQDLIPYSLREDQARLPASVSDRLALQVTEAAPFTAEVAEKLVVLPRYQQAPIPLVTTRKQGFDGPITFTARGGQLGDKDEGRTRVYAEFPAATPKAPSVSGGVHSRILSNLGTTRIEVLATATYRGRRITFIRSFDLEIRPAFTFVVEKAPAKAAPGGTVKVTLKIDRVKTFAGAVTVELSPSAGLNFPEKVTIPRGKDAVEFEVTADEKAGPGRRAIGLYATGEVDGFEEELRGRVEVEVTKAEAPKK